MLYICPWYQKNKRQRIYSMSACDQMSVSKDYKSLRIRVILLSGVVSLPSWLRNLKLRDFNGFRGDQPRLE